MRVLIVDDEPLIRLGIRRALGEAADVEVAGECATGDEAIDAIRDGGSVHLRLGGRLDREWAGHLSATLEELLRDGVRSLRIDLSTVTYISSAAAEVLARWQQEVATLRGRELAPDEIAGDALDVELRVDLADGGVVAWRVRGAAYELRREDGPTLNGNPVPGDGRVDVRVIVDHSVVEVFANGTPLTTRSYTGAGEPLAIESRDATVDLRAWEMDPA